MMRVFDAASVEEVLAYKSSPDYLPLSDQVCADNRFYRLAREAGSRGVYLFQIGEDRRRPAVFLASADNEEQARAIHRRLWNLGQSPFIIVVLPHQVRVYSGFNFSPGETHKARQTGLVVATGESSLQTLSKVLEDFSAAAIDSGTLWQRRDLLPEGRVDHRLLGSLAGLGERLCAEGLSMTTANKLIGKGIFLRYLLDRHFLTQTILDEAGLILKQVLGRDAAVSDFKVLIQWLDKRFNGCIFPLDFDSEPIEDAHIRLLAGALMGDCIYGDSLQLHLGFQAFDFSYIAIETLASIYERFLRVEDFSAVRKKGIVYTPEFLADYMISEVEAVKPLQAGMKIIDPACGSGVFLVLAYRKLIEKTLGRDCSDPERLKELLTSSIFGVEREEDACYVTELSLILTLLDHLQREDLEAHKDFKFPSLHNRCIFHADFFDQKALFWRHQQTFDWVIGNPPWADLKGVKPDQEIPFRRWLTAHKQDQPVGDSRISEGFLWETSRLLRPHGVVGLIIHAKSLTNHKSAHFRKHFFSRNRVYRLGNLANLRRGLFSGRAIAPGATIVYQTGAPPANALVTHYGPFMVNQLPKNSNGGLWTLAVSSSEIQMIPHRLIESGESTVWKAALWGHCESLLRQMHQLQGLCPHKLGELCRQKGWTLREGPQFRKDKDGKGTEISAIKQGKGRRLVNGVNRKMFLEDHHLEVIPTDQCWLRRGFLHEAACRIVIHPSWAFQIFSLKKFEVRPRQISLAGPAESEDELRALTLWLNTSLIRLHLLFLVPDWGIERDRITLNAVKNLPVPTMTADQVAALAAHHRRLVSEEHTFVTEATSFGTQIDRVVEEVLGFPPKIGRRAREFFEIPFTLNDGNTSSFVTREPTNEELLRYGEALKADLDDFVEGEGVFHVIELIRVPGGILCGITLEEADESVRVTRGTHQVPEFMEKQGQWAYVRRNLIVVESHKIILVKPARLLEWTTIRAEIDAGDVQAEVLSHGVLVAQAI